MVEGGFLPSCECGGQVPCPDEFLLWEACFHNYGVEFDALKSAVVPVILLDSLILMPRWNRCWQSVIQKW